MDRKFSDEQIDELAKHLLKDFALEDEKLDEIAESPKLWWDVRSRIEAEKQRREKSWLAAFRPQILAFGALAILIGFGLTVLFLNFAKNSNPPIAEQNPVQNQAEEIAQKSETPENLSSKDNFKVPNPPKQKTPTPENPVPEKVSVKSAVPKMRFIAKNRNIETSAKQINSSAKKLALPKNTEETKTDFIALSYAANTDSGQIVRVKVPSSMMVSLGVATTVEKESELVSAEVVIGDDGLARAIRFIR